MRLLLTGANGFVGHALCAHLGEGGHVVAPSVRRPSGLADEIVVGDIDDATDWAAAIAGCDAVVHLAACVHVMNEEAADPLAEYRRVNVDGTLRLARQAAEAGVRRFVFVSSIKVNGGWTEPGMPFRADDRPDPKDAYGMSKCEAELGLRALSQETGLELVVIRPPLVYGPGVKANFLAMMRWLARGVPLPLASVRDNRRSLVFLDNLSPESVFICHRSNATL